MKSGTWTVLFIGIITLCALVGMKDIHQPDSVLDYTVYTNNESEYSKDNLSNPSNESVIPESIIFCGKKIEVNWLIKYYIHYYMEDEGLHSRVEDIMERSTKYDKMIRQILVEENVPDDLFYLAAHESGFQTDAHSTAGASGLWQFMKNTGSLMGLQRYNELNWDERKDIERSTHAAVRLLKSLYQGGVVEYRDWLLSMAAYNVGPVRVNKAVEDYETRDYWKLKGLPFETQRYVAQIIAMKILMENPTRYGFYPSYEPAVRYEKISFKSNYALSIEKIAELAETSPLEIEIRNPAIKNVLPGRHEITLYLPPDSKEIFLSNYYSYADRRDKLKNWRRRGLDYIVRPEDTIEDVAKNFNIDISEIYYYSPSRKKWYRRSSWDMPLISGEHLKIAVKK